MVDYVQRQQTKVAVSLLALASLATVVTMGVSNLISSNNNRIPAQTVTKYNNPISYSTNKTLYDPRQGGVNFDSSLVDRLPDDRFIIR